MPVPVAGSRHDSVLLQSITYDPPDFENAIVVSHVEAFTPATVKPGIVLGSLCAMSVTSRPMPAAVEAISILNHRGGLAHQLILSSK